MIKPESFSSKEKFAKEHGEPLKNEKILKLILKTESYKNDSGMDKEWESGYNTGLGVGVNQAIRIKDKQTVSKVEFLKEAIRKDGYNYEKKNGAWLLFYDQILKRINEAFEDAVKKEKKDGGKKK